MLPSPACRLFLFVHLAKPMAKPMPENSLALGQYHRLWVSSGTGALALCNLLKVLCAYDGSPELP